MGLSFAGVLGGVKKAVGLSAEPRPPLGQITRGTSGRATLGDMHGGGAVSARICKKMRSDPQIALGLSAIKAPVLGVTWWAESEHEEAARFVEAGLSPLWRELVRWRRERRGR